MGLDEPGNVCIYASENVYLLVKINIEVKGAS